MEAAIVVVIVMIVAAAIFWGMRRSAPERKPAVEEPWKNTSPTGERVVLDLVASDPDHPSVKRLAFDAGRQALEGSPDVDRVEVVDREGTLITTVERDQPLPKELAVPATLHEPHARASRAPSAVPREGGGMPQVEHDPAAQVPARLFADRFDLGPAIRDRIRDPESPTDVIRAVLAAGGHSPTVDRDLIRVGETAVVVIPDVRDGAKEAINHAYLRYKETDAQHAILIRLGYVAPDIVRRHDAATPDVRHASSDAVQRMADAVAIGADPLAFAVGPSVIA
jgi:hypothetical protein